MNKSFDISGHCFIWLWHVYLLLSVHVYRIYPLSICLEWSEIYDGKIDCLNNDIDEKNCFQVELNECNEDEYRCHNDA